MLIELELFECTDLMRSLIVCAFGRKANFREVMSINERNCTLVFWMLLTG